MSSDRTGSTPRRSISSIRSRPHNPQADVIPKVRLGMKKSTVEPGAVTAVTMLYCCAAEPSQSTQYSMRLSCARPVMIPSAKSRPAASSKSAPGVRIVTATGCMRVPLRSRISIGSSVATRSMRGVARPSSTACNRIRVFPDRPPSMLNRPRFPPTIVERAHCGPLYDGGGLSRCARRQGAVSLLTSRMVTSATAGRSVPALRA